VLYQTTTYSTRSTVHRALSRDLPIPGNRFAGNSGRVSW